MKNHAERDPLLDDLLGDGDGLREASLERGLAALRAAKRAQRQRPARWAGVVAVVASAVLVLRPDGEVGQEPPVPPAVGAKPVALVAPAPEARIQIISDDELLAQFPDRAVAIVGPEGERQLVFLDVKTMAGGAQAAQLEH